MPTPISDTARRRLTGWLKREAGHLGFDACGICAADAIPQAAPRLMQALLEGHHGSMAWMAQTADRRGTPRGLWGEVRSVLMVGQNYGPDHDPLDVLADPRRAAISVYAQRRDYHDILKGRLKTLASKLVARARALGADSDVKVFVDTAPVMEKPLAEASGLGWQGKHSNLVSRSFGSWLFLGALYTTLDLDADAPEPDHCGQCQRCLDACPTRAFAAPYRVDARRCISYLTIENKGPIPREFREALGNRVFGCDDCLAVCPWNKFAQEASDLRLAAQPALAALGLDEALTLDDAGFRSSFASTPVKRIGRERFLRNILMAAGNSREHDLLPKIVLLLDDAAPLVRGAAIWALAQLEPETAHRQARLRKAEESDTDVLAEWQAVIDGKA